MARVNRLTEEVENTDDYIKLATKDKQEFINKLGRLEDIEEEIGCPLEVREKAIKYGIYIKNIYGEMVNFKVMLVYKNEQMGYYFRFINDGYVLLADYKKTWWLKRDKSE